MEPPQEVVMFDAPWKLAWSGAGLRNRRPQSDPVHAASQLHSPEVQTPFRLQSSFVTQVAAPVASSATSVYGMLSAAKMTRERGKTLVTGR